jgi:hypothetical protein
MRRLSVLLFAGLAVLFAANLALAATKRLEGPISGSDGGKVTLKAALSPGSEGGKKVMVVHTLSGITVTDVPYRCEDGSSGSISAKFGRTVVGDTLSFHADTQATPTMSVYITGKLSDQFAKKVTGQVRAEGAKVLPEGSKITCGTFELGSTAGTFVAK